MPSTREGSSLRNAGASISLGGVQKDYGDTTVLRDIDLDIAPGEFMTLLGPSGSGKTTTLGLIAGFTDPTHGVLAVDGNDLSPIPMHRRDIGVVFQNYALFPHMTVADNVAFPLKQRRLKGEEVRRRVAEALETVRMTGLEDRYPAQLSGGQQQRVAFARSIVFGPRVLLMDEPLGALDKKLRDWLQLEIRRIHAEVGSTFVYVTHDQDEALSLSDRIAVFNNGMIEQVGTPQELYESPATLFVAQFIGESTIFPGTVASRSDGISEVTGAGRWKARDAKGKCAEGDRVALLVRPEHLRLRPAAEAVSVAEVGSMTEASSRSETSSVAEVSSRSLSEVNQAEVTVQDVIYLGTGYRCTFQLSDGTHGVCRLSAAVGAQVRVGAPAIVEWDVAEGVLLADPDGTSVQPRV